MPVPHLHVSDPCVFVTRLMILIFRRKSFKSEGAWNGHVNSPAHKGNDNRCPLCLRVFHSATALIQHMESPTERCAVRSTRVYSSVVSMVSGGFLEVAGEHDDGTARFESQTPPDYRW